MTARSEAGSYSILSVLEERRVREIMRQEIEAYALRNRCTCDCPEHPKSKGGTVFSW